MVCNLKSWILIFDYLFKKLGSSRRRSRRETSFFCTRNSGTVFHSYHGKKDRVFSRTRMTFGDRGETRLFAVKQEIDTKWLEDHITRSDKAAAALVEETVRKVESSESEQAAATLSRWTTLQKIIQKMEEGLVERSEEVKLLLLAALCREHLLLLGPPGTGTLILRCLTF